MDPDGRYSWDQLKKDWSEAWSAVKNLDFGYDYTQMASQAWSAGNYFQAAIYELDASCEMVLDLGLAYFGAELIGNVIADTPSTSLGIVANSNATTNTAQVSNVSNRCAELGSKLDYLLGKATGNAHNIARSAAMKKSLENIGLGDSNFTRAYLTNYFNKVLNDPLSVKEIQKTGRIVRESLLMGPNGGVKVNSIWEDSKLITVEIFGGAKNGTSFIN